MNKPEYTEQQFLEEFGVSGEFKGVNYDQYNGNAGRQGRGVYYCLLSDTHTSFDIDVMAGWVCFRDMYARDSGGYHTFFIGFPRWMWKSEGIEEYTHWVINESFFADVFITKDVKVVREYGAFVRTDVPRYMTEGAITLLRLGFDTWTWDWHKFVAMGYDGMTAQILALHACESNGGTLNLHSVNSGHVLVRQWVSWDHQNLKIVKHNDNSYMNLNGKRKPLNSYHFGPEKWPDRPPIEFGEKKEIGNGFNTYKTPVFNQENVEILLQKLKSL